MDYLSIPQTHPSGKKYCARLTRPFGDHFSQPSPWWSPKPSRGSFPSSSVWHPLVFCLPDVFVPPQTGRSFPRESPSARGTESGPERGFKTRVFKHQTPSPGFHKFGYPKNIQKWMVYKVDNGKSIYKWMRTGGTPISGNLHVQLGTWWWDGKTPEKPEPKNLSWTFKANGSAAQVSVTRWLTLVDVCIL